MKEKSDILNEENGKLKLEIEEKDELLKSKESEILNLDQKVNEEQAKSQTLNEKNKDLAQNLKEREFELVEMKTKDASTNDLSQKLKEQMLSHQTLNTRNVVLEETVKINEKEIEETKLKV